MNLELTPAVLLSKLQSLPFPSHTTNKNSAKKILVAFSGGLDSHVLLHLLSRISTKEINLRALYVNHGLQAEANQWAIHCQSICATLGVAYASVDLNLSVPKGESIEELARVSRYQALADNIKKDEILVTAHHQNDQAETLLLQLFRGAGVQGLAAMPIAGEFNAGKNSHFRPLIEFSRDQLEAYAENFDLKHIEDPSNKDTAFERNFLRQNIMPSLRERWLGIDKTISRSAAIQAETKALLDEFAAEELPKVLATDFYYAEQVNELSLAPIDITLLHKLSPNKQRLVLRYWISQQGFLNPSDTKLAHIFTDLIDASDDKQPLIEWAGVELRRYQKQIFIMPPLSEHDPSKIISWGTKNRLSIESLSIPIDQSELSIAPNDSNEEITIRFRQGGEKIEMPNRGNISLKNLFQELQIPPWIRSRLPLIYIGEKLIKIVGLEQYKRHPPTF